MRIDVGDLCSPHLQMVIESSLIVHGLDAVGWEPALFDNPYKDIGPEYTYGDSTDMDGPEEEPDFSCKVLLSEPIEGYELSLDFISLSDKLESEYTIISDRKLQSGEKLLVTWPSGKTLKLRVVNQTKEYNFASNVGFIQKGVVI